MMTTVRCIRKKDRERESTGWRPFSHEGAVFSLSTTDSTYALYHWRFLRCFSHLCLIEEASKAIHSVYNSNSLLEPVHRLPLVLDPNG